MAIGPEEARKVAELARVEVSDEDLPTIARELTAILGFMERLNAVDVEGVEALTSVTPMKVRTRPDKVTSGNMAHEILANAPEAREGYFVVPKVVE